MLPNFVKVMRARLLEKFALRILGFAICTLPSSVVAIVGLTQSVSQTKRNTQPNFGPMHRGVWPCCRPSIKIIEKEGGGSRPVAASRCPARYYRSDYDWYLGAAVSRKSGIRLRLRRRRLSTRDAAAEECRQEDAIWKFKPASHAMQENSHMKSAVGG